MTAQRGHIAISILLVLGIITMPARLAAQKPRLEAIYQHSNGDRFEGGTPASRYSNFQGLLLEEHMIWAMYPLLPWIFFDAGSAAIPDRYVLFTDPAQTGTFTDSTIPGGTLEKYYHLLNVVGYRMRKHPETRIEIIGNNSGERAIGETAETSGKRARTLYDYLVRIWNIDPSRIALLPSHDPPESKAAARYPEAIEENRRAEIRSSDWELLKPVINREIILSPQTDGVAFRVSNGIADPLVLRRVIEIRRHGEPWHVINDIGRVDTFPPFHWGRNDDPDVLPNDEAPYTAQLVVHDAQGTEHRSEEIVIPVKIVTHEEKRIEKLIDATVERYILLVLTFSEPKPSQLNQRILREFVYGAIRQGARIEVTGYTDMIGPREVNLKLAEQRARTVRDEIRRNVPKGVIASLESRVAGEEDMRYSNALPEGRCHNRMVEIIVTTPVGEY